MQQNLQRHGDRLILNFKCNRWLESGVSKFKTLKKKIFESIAYWLLSSSMYVFNPTLSTRSRKSSRIPASLKKLVQGRVDGCSSPSSPSSPMLGEIRSSL
jgi:hypothetical protein